MSLEVVKNNLENRGFVVYIAKNSEESKKIAFSLIPPIANIGSGGSVTLDQLNIRKELKERGNKVEYSSLLSKDDFDKFDPKDMNWFITSTNALTLDGQLVNTDGAANRISNMVYGPTNVLFFVGKNKIVDNIDDAFKRIHQVATPLNLVRLNKNIEDKSKHRTAQEIERVSLIMHAPSRGKKVYIILIEEDLGY